ncbi:MAG: PfkB family carbohydrate kinase [Chloroflexota bacterium]|jgi:fructokinase
MTELNVDVVCLGELLVDMFPAEIGRRLAEVTAFYPKPGGAPANVAAGIARLGRRSAFIGKVGDDAFGHHLAAVLAAEAVETRGMRFDSEARTTMAFIASPDPNTNEYLFYRNPGADTRLRAEELDEALLRNCKALHFGSLSLVEEPIRSAALRAVEIVVDSGGMVSLDVNYRPTLWSSADAAYEAVMAIIARVDLLKVNEEELRLLTGESDPSVGGMALIKMGPKLCVMTSGTEGSHFATVEGTGFVPAFPVKTVDATGCGDSFVAGLLSQLTAIEIQTTIPGVEQMQRIVSYANAVGALTAQTKGVIPALPNADAVEHFLASHHS